MSHTRSMKEALNEATDTFRIVSDTLFVRAMLTSEKITANQPVSVKLASSMIFGVSAGVTSRVVGIAGGAFTFFCFKPKVCQSLDLMNQQQLSKL